MVKVEWGKIQIEGWVGHRSFKKLQGLRRELKAWNQNEFGNVGDKVKKVETKLHEMVLLAEVISRLEFLGPKHDLIWVPNRF